MLWTNEYLADLALEAEIEIAKKLPCIIDRYSLSVEIGIAEYQLPEYVTNIRRVFWKGTRLDPVSHLEIDDWVFTWEQSTFGAFTEVNYQETAFDIDDIIGATPMGKPTRYFYSKLGENVIRLNPTPNENVGVFDALYGANIPNAVIVEFYREPDGVNWKLPEYIRRRTIKSYVMWKAFAREGDGQNLSASQYWQGRYAVNLERANKIILHLHSSLIQAREPNHLSHGGFDEYGYQGPYVPARPVLPPNYGITVEDYE